MNEEKDMINTGHEPEWIRPDDRDFFELYANMMHIMWTLDDVTVRIGQLVPDPETASRKPPFKPVVEETGAVTFPWRGAKMLRDQLTKVIESYEKVNGEIKLEVKLPPTPE